MTLAQDERLRALIERGRQESLATRATTRPFVLKGAQESQTKSAEEENEARRVFGIGDQDEEPEAPLRSESNPFVQMMRHRLLDMSFQQPKGVPLGSDEQIFSPEEMALAYQNMAKSGAEARAAMRLGSRAGRFAGGVLGGAAMGPLGMGIGGVAGVALPELLGKKPPEAASPMMVDIATSLAAGAGAAAFGFLGMKGGDLIFKGPVSRVSSYKELLTRGGVTGTAMSGGAGATGGATYAALTDRPVLKTAGLDALLGATAGFVTSAGIPLGFRGLGALLRKVGFLERSPLPKQYEALEREMADLQATPGAMTVPRGYEFLSLGAKELKEARSVALRIGMPVHEYAQFLDDVAHQNVIYPETLELSISKALWNSAQRSKTAPPPLSELLSTTRGAVAAELGVPLEEIPKRLYTFKATERVGEWWHNYWSKHLEKFGIAPGEAHNAARHLLQEYHGERQYWSDMARRKMALGWEKMSEEERARAGVLLHGNIKEGAARSETDLGPLDTSLPTPEARQRELNRLGREIAQEGRLTTFEEVQAIRGDPLLTKDGVATTILTRRLINDLEEAGMAEKIGAFSGRGIHRTRTWITKEVQDALKNEDIDALHKALQRPTMMAVSGVGRLKRDWRILEVDQRDGGAWGIRNTKTRELLPDRFTDPNAAGRAVAAGRKEGKPWRVENPITWREAMEGTTKAGRLVVDDIMPDAVRMTELGNEVALARFMRELAANPTLSRPKGSPDAPGWRRLSDDPIRYGAASGALVRKNIYDHITDTVDHGPSLWKGVMGGWVWARLGMSPSTHFRNMMWNLIAHNHPSVGGSPLKALVYWADGAREIMEKGPIYDFLVRSGAIMGEFGETVGRIWKDHLSVLAKGGEKSAWSLWDRFKSDITLSSRTYGAEDQIAAVGSVFKLMREDGFSPFQAVDRMKEAFSDFRLMRKTWPLTNVKIGEGRFQNPFVKFDVEQLRVFNNGLKRGPEGWLWLANWYGAYPMAMTAASLYNSGLTWDEFVEMQKYRPNSRAADFYGVILPNPGKDEKGRTLWKTFDWSSPLPFIEQRGDVRLDQMFDMESLNWPMRTGISAAARLFSNPLSMATLTAISGLNLYTGQSVTGPGESEGWARVREGFRQSAPIPGYWPGFYWEKKFRESATGVKKGGPVQRAQRLSDFIPRFYAGLKTFTVEPNERDLFEGEQTMAMLKQRDELFKLASKLSTGEYTDAEYRVREREILRRIMLLEQKQAKGRPPSLQVDLLRPFLGPGKEK